MATIANTCSAERDQDKVVEKDRMTRYKIVANAGEATAIGELYIDSDLAATFATGPTITITYTT